MDKIDSFRGQYSFLSNFHPCEILYENLIYKSSEALYQAMKTDDHEEKRKIAILETPGQAKRAGRKLKSTRDWNNRRISCMEKTLIIKFKDPLLRKKLLETGNTELVETNDWGDKFWGISGGIGENHLGKLLMRVRSKIRNRELL